MGSGFSFVMGLLLDSPQNDNCGGHPRTEILGCAQNKYVKTNSIKHDPFRRQRNRRAVRRNSGSKTVQFWGSIVSRFSALRATAQFKRFQHNDKFRGGEQQKEAVKGQWRFHAPSSRYISLALPGANPDDLSKQQHTQRNLRRALRTASVRHIGCAEC